MCWVRGWRSSQEWILMQGGNNEGFLSAPMAGIQTIGEIIQAEHVPWKRLIFFQINLMMSLWTCSHSDSLGLVVKTNSFSSTAPCARTVTCSCVVGCLEFSWCQGRFEKTAFATRLPFLGRPAPPPRTWALSPWIKKYKTLKNKTTALQAYQFQLQMRWNYPNHCLHATVWKKAVFCFHYSWFQFKIKSFMSIYRWQCLQHIAWK